MVFVVKDINVIFRKIKTILNLINFKRYFSHPEKSILNLSLPSLQGGIVIPGSDPYLYNRTNCICEQRRSIQVLLKAFTSRIYIHTAKAKPDDAGSDRYLGVLLPTLNP